MVITVKCYSKSIYFNVGDLVERVVNVLLLHSFLFDLTEPLSKLPLLLPLLFLHLLQLLLSLLPFLSRLVLVATLRHHLYLSDIHLRCLFLVSLRLRFLLFLLRLFDDR